ncbi:MAG: hypothetical protein ACREX0_17385 [Noviherbaspirillum sp.]
MDIGVRCAGFGRTSVRFVLEIHLGDQHLISGELVYVYADTAVRKGVRWPDEWRETISRFEKRKPEPL